MAHLGEPQQGETPGEDTNVYVKRLLATRGKTRRPVMFGVAVLAVLLTLMALKWGSHRHEDLEIMGPVYDVKAGDTVVQEAPPEPAAPAPKKIEGAPASVDVVLDAKGQLWVDGRAMSASKPKHELKLAPGPHVLMAKQNGKMMTQKITVGPSEVYEVTFGTKIRVMRQAD